ncbi:hypothetical protein [Modestobacter sp. I12A-02662]|uniref:hypothetical protein n=1 Tax=Modestobacter sp. I12A-02662 TaxID=1730496 RepID=UPI0034DE2F58
MRRGPATEPPPARRSRWALAVAPVVLALAGLAFGPGQLPLPAITTTSVSSAVSLVDDGGGVALFSAGRLAPGRADTACVGLTAGGSVDPASEVQLSTVVETADLAPYLLVSVERGSVPPGGDCTSFSGTQVWTGTLADFPAAGTAGIPTGWRPALTPRSVYRFNVAVLDDPRAQGLAASATFRWSFTEAVPAPTPAPAPHPAPAPTPAPAPSPVPEPAPSPSPVPEPSPTLTPTPATTPTPTALPARDAKPDAVPSVPDVRGGAITAATAPPPTSPYSTSDTATAPSTSPASAPALPTLPGSSAAPAAPSGDSDVIEAPPLRAGPLATAQAVAEAVVGAAVKAASAVRKTAGAVADDGQFPLALLAVVAGFLFLQGRIDRRDPKLALARVREELSEYREFPEPPSTETT